NLGKQLALRKEGAVMNRPVTRGPQARPRPDRPPQNRRLPAVYRLPAEDRAPAGQGELGREPALALVEAALFAADEPLTARRLAVAVGLADGTEVRRLVRKLQALYDKDGTAFQVEELAGGFQLLTRPEYHPWLVRLKRTGNDLK